LSGGTVEGAACGVIGDDAAEFRIAEVIAPRFWGFGAGDYVLARNV